MLKNNLTLTIFLLLSLYGCYTELSSSKATNNMSINTQEGNYFPHIIVEGTTKLQSGGVTRSSSRRDWETLEDCLWIDPVYITPRSIILKFASVNNNRRVRVYGTLCVDKEIYVVADSIKMIN
jgi:hypothetical protein